MRRICATIVTGILVTLIDSWAYSQGYIATTKTIIIQPYQLFITFNKTTSLIFPYAIKSVDRGSQDVLAQKAIGVENILFVKAGRENFNQTNLSVITTDGKLYSFLLDYISNPATLNIFFTKDTISNGTVPLLLHGNNEAQLQSLTKRIAKVKTNLPGIKDGKYRMLFRLNGIYVKNDVIYYKLELQNRSNINYDIEMLRFFIRDEKKYKRTASQEIEMHPLYVYGDTSLITSQSKNILVFALPKFTVSERKFLYIQLMEKNGGRHLHLNVQNRSIVKATQLPE
ncbi:MAG: conjugative transposon protein TraN [Chitinophagaceae bacterium]